MKFKIYFDNIYQHYYIKVVYKKIISIIKKKNSKPRLKN